MEPKTYSDMTKDLKTESAYLQFLFPFMLKEDKVELFAEKLLEDDFIFFDLKDMKQQDAFYGGKKIHHRTLESYFMPNIERFLFPGSYRDKEGFRRFTNNQKRDCLFTSDRLVTEFTVDSFDIFLCPFHIGLINIRVTLPDHMDYSDVLFFGDTFRVLEPIDDDEETVRIECSGESHKLVKDFIFKELSPIMRDYIDEDEGEASSYFGSLPFFIDERMYVISQIALPPDSRVTKTDLFRAGQLNGYDRKGKPFVGANNPDYIDRYYTNNVYDRWGDETYYVMSEYNFACVTRTGKEFEGQISSQMYGKDFYSLLLFFYYKIVLMKLTHAHAKLDIEKDQSSTELLIVMITEFSAKYLFPEVNSSTSGREISQIFKVNFGIDRLYNDVKKTLASLYQNQDKLSGKRNNYLLQILTIYTVISGIYGMNLVISDWKGEVKWSKLAHYTIFEYLSFFVAISGIIISIVIGMASLKSYLRERKSRRKKI
ncbi:hypothetical protein ACN6MY_00540 [Peribacillus sp. B-H-3]|uniref:hypothetical protein n=1 Tax=Peribacillus sp. B-H-3 TaxID=3400420 RepID=UPI003B0289BE